MHEVFSSKIQIKADQTEWPSGPDQYVDYNNARSMED